MSKLNDKARLLQFVVLTVIFLRQGCLIVDDKDVAIVNLSKLYRVTC